MSCPFAEGRIQQVGASLSILKGKDVIRIMKNRWKLVATLCTIVDGVYRVRIPDRFMQEG